MSSRSFQELLQNSFRQKKFVSVGLDSDFEKIPQHIKRELLGSVQAILRDFTRCVAEATGHVAGVFKPNIAFYEACGPDGIGALREIIRYIKAKFPDVPIILDFKRADIGNTNNGYVQEAFEYFGADAVTINPYLGMEAMKPFLEKKEKGFFVLCRTSNPGAGEFQDLKIALPKMPTGAYTLFEYIARRVSVHWNANGNCGLVVGATYPEELARVRKLVDDMPILIPGVGKQGGDAKTAVKNGANSKQEGFIINSSGAILFASSGADFAEAARREAEKLHNQILEALQEISKEE